MAERSEPPEAACAASLARVARNDLEPERAGEGRGLDEAHLDRVAQPIGLAGARANERTRPLLVAEIVVAERRRGHEAVGAGLGQFDEQADAGDAGDARPEHGADPVGEMSRDKPVDRLAFGRHSAALGGRNVLGDLRELAAAHVVEPAVAKPERADQRAMNDQVGVAADRRGEMRVSAQIEAEMAVVLVAIFRLRLGAQHDLVDQRLDRLPANAAEHAVEMRGAHPIALGELDADRAQELDEIVELLDARRVMRAVEKRRMRRFQRLGGGDIGEDHEFLDQTMRLEPLRPSDAGEPPLLVEDQLALGQVEIERVPTLALDLHDGVRGVERLQHAFEERRRRLVRPSVDRGLRLFVRQPGGRAHHDAMESMRALAAVSAEDHAHRERRPVFERAQRAEVVGDALGQHRHDPVGKIDRIAAFQRLAVERRPGPHIGGDVGDGDRDDEAAGIGGIRIGRGVDGVVVILGVRRVDGDERQLSPVLARRREADRAGALGLFQRCGREDMRDVMGWRAR